LGVGANDTVGSSVDTREVLAVTLAAFEHTRGIRGRGIVLATDTIEYVLAVACSVWSARVACLQAECTSTHKVVPFDSLDVVVGVSGGCREGISEKETTKGVSTLIGTVRIHLTTIVVGGNVDVGLVDETSDCRKGQQITDENVKYRLALDIIWSLDESHTSDRAGRNDAGTWVNRSVSEISKPTRTMPKTRFLWINSRVLTRGCHEEIGNLPWPGFVHHATASPSIFPMTLFGSCAPHRQKSTQK